MEKTALPVVSPMLCLWQEVKSGCKYGMVMQQRYQGYSYSDHSAIHYGYWFFIGKNEQGVKNSWPT